MIYFDNAATSKHKPKSVIDAAVRELRDGANPGRGSHSDAVDKAKTVYSTREVIKKHLNANRHEVVFTKNCTEALNLAILGSARNGHIITTVNEHNSVLRPIFKLSKEGSVAVTVLGQNPSGCIDGGMVERAVRSDTYLLCVNHISNVTGAEVDLAELSAVAEKHGIILLVDAAQSAGHKKIDVSRLGIDMLAAPGHKGLHAPQGVGFLLINPAIKLQPILYGGTGTEGESVYQPSHYPEAFESGTLNTPAIAGLREGIEWTEKNRCKLEEHLTKLSAIFLSYAKHNKNIEIYTKNVRNGIISFNIRGLHSTTAGDILNEKYDIAARCGLHCAPLIHKEIGTLAHGAVRVSFGWNNTEKEVYKLINAIEKL